MKKMKAVFYFIFAVGIIVSLSSCFSLFATTHKFVVDKNVSVDQSVIVTFVNDTKEGWFLVKQWNGNNIEKDVYGNKGTSSNDKTRLTVPVGNNSFTFNAYYTFSNQYNSTTYTFKDIELKYNLEQEKKYQIKGRIKSLGFFKGSEFFVGIYDVTGRENLLKEWKLGES